jgi:pSer/pThr/pTyr-binding forkhead associated (FHA) protein
MATPKGYLLVDSSTNGTYVNGEKVQGQRLLARADVIKAGEDEFRFYADAVPAAAAVPVAAAAAPPPPPKPAPAPPSPKPAASGTASTLGAEQRLANTMFGIKPPDAKSASRPSQSGPLATLIGRTGAFKGQRFPIRVPVVNVGRADYNDIVLVDDSVSTVHAKLQRREGVWVVVDLDSTNGTFVDGERISGESPIVPGALLRFGGIGMMFESTDDAIDPSKGSSTKMMQAVKAPPPPSKSGPSS